MTPIAHQLARQLTLPPMDRKAFWNSNIDKLEDSLTSIHCFELTRAIPLFFELRATLNTIDKFEEAAVHAGFLPAPKTWMEWVRNDGLRIALLLEDAGLSTSFEDATPRPSASVTLFDADGAQELGLISQNSGDYWRLGGRQSLPTAIFEEFGESAADALLAFAQFMLVLVNSPRIIGRREHAPHKGLKRELARAASKIQPRPWTEILLQVSKPRDIDDGEPHEAMLTGKRALHFCRKHIRIRLGKLEYVRAHWRGDPTIGVRQSYYTVRA